MKNANVFLKTFKTGGLIFLLGVGTSTYAGSSYKWKEEVLLHDGNKIVAERSVERGGGHEIGQEPPIREQTLSFIRPNSGERITWEDKFTEDVGTANFLPMLLDFHGDAIYLVVHPMGSLSFAKWGRPNPPYVVFEYQHRAWQRISMQDLPAALKTPNLIFSSPDRAAQKAQQRVVSADRIRSLYDGYDQVEYKTILRTPLDYWKPKQIYSGPKAPHPIASSSATVDKK